MDAHIAEQFSRTLSNVDETLREINAVCYEQNRPFYLLKPRVFPDGDSWCALYGADLQEGVAAFGDTPANAARQFNVEWLNAKAQHYVDDNQEIDMPYSGSMERKI